MRQLIQQKRIIYLWHLRLSKINVKTQAKRFWKHIYIYIYNKIIYNESRKHMAWYQWRKLHSFAWELFTFVQWTGKRRLRELTNDWHSVPCLCLGLASLKVPLCLLHKMMCLDMHTINWLCWKIMKNISHACPFFELKFHYFQVWIKYFPTYFLVDFHQNISCIWLTISAFINDHLAPLS